MALGHFTRYANERSQTSASTASCRCQSHRDEDLRAVALVTGQVKSLNTDLCVGGAVSCPDQGGGYTTPGICQIS